MGHRLCESFKFFLSLSRPLWTAHLPRTSTVLSKHGLYTYNVRFYTAWSPKKKTYGLKTQQVRWVVTGALLHCHSLPKTWRLCSPPKNVRPKTRTVGCDLGLKPRSPRTVLASACCLLAKTGAKIRNPYVASTP
jgi:hypothetical protein